MAQVDVLPLERFNAVWRPNEPERLKPVYVERVTIREALRGDLLPSLFGIVQLIEPTFGVSPCQITLCRFWDMQQWLKAGGCCMLEMCIGRRATPRQITEYLMIDEVCICKVMCVLGRRRCWSCTGARAAPAGSSA